MKSEYLILNLIIIAGPLLLSFDKRVRFVQYWLLVFLSILISAIPFITWDALVAGRHWWFNTRYTLDFSFLGLPAGELLFFITVPYACLFTWEVLAAYLPNRTLDTLRYKAFYFYLPLFLLGIVLYVNGKEYSGLVLFSLAFILFLNARLKTKLFQMRRTYEFSGLLLIMILIFNGYLTARPVVLYDPAFQWDLRIYTIPVEDFIYGFDLIFLNLIIYERLKRKSRA